MITRECENCNNEMILRIVNKKGSKNFGQIIIQDKNKRFCSRKCLNEWQNKISWEERVGKEIAEKIRKDTSERVKGDKNPTCNKEIAKKVSESLKIYLKDHPEERIGENNAFYGKTHTEKFKENAKETRIGKRSYNDEQYKRKIENQPCGKDCHLWQGGISYEVYPKEFNKKLKKNIKIRDNYTCVICDKKTQKLDIHHIDYNKTNSNERNLISLCHSCHSKTNINRNKWEIFFVSIINEKYDNITD
jgi:hypothetical protein